MPPWFIATRRFTPEHEVWQKYIHRARLRLWAVTLPGCTGTVFREKRTLDFHDLRFSDIVNGSTSSPMRQPVIQNQIKC